MCGTFGLGGTMAVKVASTKEDTDLKPTQSITNKTKVFSLLIIHNIIIIQSCLSRVLSPFSIRFDGYTPHLKALFKSKKTMEWYHYEWSGYIALGGRHDSPGRRGCPASDHIFWVHGWTMGVKIAFNERMIFG